MSGRGAPRRRGSAHVVALGLGLLLATVGIGGTLAGRRVLARAEDGAAVAAVRAGADAAVAWGLRRLERSAAYAGGTVADTATHEVVLDGVVVRAAIGPFGGSVPANRHAPAVLAGVARSGVASRRIELRALPAPTAPSAVHGPLAVGGTLHLAASSELVLLEGVGVAASIARGADVEVKGDLLSTTPAAGDSWSGAVAAARRPVLPSPAALAAFAADATPIAVAGNVVERWLLSPTFNSSGGALDPRGLYVLDCAGRSIVIRSSRIVGTLVLVNPGVGTRVEGSVHFAPAVRGYPSLVVLGSLRIALDGADLTEAGTSSVNFNPVGTPYPHPGGEVDGDRVDAYPSTIAGLVVVRDHLTIAGSSALLGGVSSGGDLTVAGAAVVGRDRWIRTLAPAALRASRWRIEEGTVLERYGP